MDVVVMVAKTKMHRSAGRSVVTGLDRLVRTVCGLEPHPPSATADSARIVISQMALSGGART